jgi:hypothetical protein
VPPGRQLRPEGAEVEKRKECSPLTLATFVDLLAVAPHRDLVENKALTAVLPADWLGRDTAVDALVPCPRVGAVNILGWSGHQLIVKSEVEERRDSRDSCLVTAADGLAEEASQEVASAGTVVLDGLRSLLARVLVAFPGELYAVAEGGGCEGCGGEEGEEGGGEVHGGGLLEVSVERSGEAV